MKKLFDANHLKAFLSVMVLTVVHLFAMAQDKVVTTTKRTETYWYVQPWVWVVAGIAVVLLLVFLFTGRNKTTIIEKHSSTIE